MSLINTQEMNAPELKIALHTEFAVNRSTNGHCI